VRTETARTRDGHTGANGGKAQQLWHRTSDGTSPRGREQIGRLRRRQHSTWQPQWCGHHADGTHIPEQRTAHTSQHSGSCTHLPLVLQSLQQQRADLGRDGGAVSGAHVRDEGLQADAVHVAAEARTGGVIDGLTNRGTGGAVTYGEADREGGTDGNEICRVGRGSAQQVDASSAVRSSGAELWARLIRSPVAGPLGLSTRVRPAHQRGHSLCCGPSIRHTLSPQLWPAAAQRPLCTSHQIQTPLHTALHAGLSGARPHVQHAAAAAACTIRWSLPTGPGDRPAFTLHWVPRGRLLAPLRCCEVWHARGSLNAGELVSALARLRHLPSWVVACRGMDAVPEGRRPRSSTQLVLPHGARYLCGAFSPRPPRAFMSIPPGAALSAAAQAAPCEQIVRAALSARKLELLLPRFAARY